MTSHVADYLDNPCSSHRFGIPAAQAPGSVPELRLGGLAGFERVVFECARPRTMIVTTPIIEYNVRCETLPAGNLRHKDHRFEWTRAEFEEWASGVAQRFGYSVRFASVGSENEELGSPTQMGVLQRA